MYIQLSDKQWETIRDYLPPLNMNGRPRCEDRAVINGILYVLKTGCQWLGLPKRLRNREPNLPQFQKSY